MSDTEVESVNTMVPLSYTEIVANIKLCASECTQNGDFISFSTLLDIYLEDWSSYSVDERLELMELLYTILNENKDLLAEIAWDLPPLLLPFLDCEWPIRFGLKESVQVVAFYKIFSLLAEYGNPKELLLTSSEEIKKLRDPESIPIQESQLIETEAKLDDAYKEKYADINEKITSYLSFKDTNSVLIKFHALFECMKFCVERIETIYPSKFLGIIVSTILNFTNNAPDVSGAISVLRTLYLFIRDYIPPDIPDKLTDSKEDLEKIFDDECYLQRKLIRLLFDTLCEKFTQVHYNVLVAKLLPALSHFDYINVGKKFLELSDRLLTLMLSLDINATETLAEQIEINHQIFSKNMDRINKVEDIIRLSISSYNNSSFRSKNPTELPISNTTLVYLYTYSKYAENWKINLPDSITVFKLIEFQLKLLIPFTVDSNLTNLTTLSYLMVLTILKIEQSKIIVPQDQFKQSRIKLIIITYLQNVASIISKSGTNAIIVKKLYSKFLQKFLQHLPDNMSYEFIMDSLENCPFDENIVCLLSIYKNLISTANYDDEKLTKDFSELSTSEDKPPILPKRPLEPASNFITFTEARQDEFIKLVEDCIAKTFDKSEIGIDVMNSNRLLSFLNFINTVKFANFEKVKLMLEGIKESVLKIKKNVDEQSDQNIELVLQLIDFSVNSTLNKIYSSK